MTSYQFTEEASPSWSRRLNKLVAAIEQVGHEDWPSWQVLPTKLETFNYQLVRAAYIYCGYTNRRTKSMYEGLNTKNGVVLKILLSSLERRRWQRGAERFRAAVESRAGSGGRYPPPAFLLYLRHIPYPPV